MFDLVKRISYFLLLLYAVLLISVNSIFKKLFHPKKNNHCFQFIILTMCLFALCLRVPQSSRQPSERMSTVRTHTKTCHQLAENLNIDKKRLLPPPYKYNMKWLMTKAAIFPFPWAQQYACGFLLIFWCNPKKNNVWKQLILVLLANKCTVHTTEWILVCSMCVLCSIITKQTIRMAYKCIYSSQFLWHCLFLDSEFESNYRRLFARVVCTRFLFTVAYIVTVYSELFLSAHNIYSVMVVIVGVLLVKWSQIRAACWLSETIPCAHKWVAHIRNVRTIYYSLDCVRSSFTLR